MSSVVVVAEVLPVPKLMVRGEAFIWLKSCVITSPSTAEKGIDATNSAPKYLKIRFIVVSVKKSGAKVQQKNDICKRKAGKICSVAIFTHFLKWDLQKSLTKVLFKSY